MQISDVLKVAAKGLRNHAARDELGERLKDRLSKLSTVADSLLSEIEAVEALIVLKVEDDRPAKPAELARMSVEELVESTILLGAIHRAGVTIKGHTRFSEVEFDLAEKIAERFQDYSLLLKAYRAARDSRDGKTFLINGGPAAKPFLDLLITSGIVKVRKLLLKKDKGWSPFKFEWLAGSKPAQSILVVFTVEDSALNHFLSGDWMTAFVMKVVTDHLDRNKVAHETFAKLGYSAPVDLIKSQSDFDVISLFSRQAHCFECKSGAMNEASASEIRRKATEISGVLQKFAPEIDAFSFYVVYDSEMVSDEAAQGFFAGSEIKPLRTDQIRELIFGLM